MSRAARESGVKPIEPRETLAQRAYTALRRAIRDGGLVQGEVYSEGELAGSLGISRTPVREALIELSREDLVEILPQRGFRLRTLDEKELAEVFGLRLALEGFIAEKLAKEVSDDGVRALRDLLEQQERATRDPAQFLLLDEQFHLLMPELLGLERTSQMLRSLRGAVWLMGSLALSIEERAPHVLGEHRAIVDAIEAHDARGAVRAVRRHLESTLRAAEAKTHGESRVA